MLQNILKTALYIQLSYSKVLIMISISTVKYASVLPGTGKTKWAIDELLTNLSERQQIIIYVAPTVVLLEEVNSKLKAKSKASDHAHIYPVYGSALKDNAASVGHHLELLLIGGVDRFHNAYRPIKHGVVLCTHEGFTRMRHDGHNDLMQARLRTRIIFDEARKCTMNVKKFTMPKDIADTLFKKHLQIEDYSQVPLDNVYRPMKVLTSNQEDLHNLFAKNKQLRKTYSDLSDYLESAASGATKVYAAIAYTYSNKENLFAILHTMLVPYKLFYGWADVVLLSAFFENSQMYHMLSQNDFGSEVRGEDESKKAYLLRLRKLTLASTPINLVDITSSVVNPKRVEVVKKRYAQTSITYLSPDVTFSKRHLDQSVMVGTKALDTLDSDFRSRCRELGGSVTLRSILNIAQRDSTEHFEAAPKFKALIKEIASLPGLVKQYTPLQWYARASIYISNQWYLKNKKEVQAVPITCNAGFNQQYVKEISLAAPTDSWVSMPFQSHGLNTFKGYDTIAFLATLNPKPEVKAIMHQLCPDYDPDLDYTLDQCIQSSTRCSIRDTKSKSKPLIIVVDNNLAAAVKKHLCDLPTIIEPETFKIPIRIPVYLSASQQKAHRESIRETKKRYNAKPESKIKSKQAMAKLRDRPEYKEKLTFIKANSKYAKRINSLGTLSTRYKKNGDPRLELVQKELIELRALFKKEKVELLKSFGKGVKK